MHRDVQSDNEARRRANIGNRQVSSRRAGSITLHCSQNLPAPLRVAVIGNNTIVQPVSATIDAHLALQDELNGTEKGTSVVFLHTTVNDGEHFQQILAWTLKSLWQKRNQLLREVAGSFRSEKVTRLHHRSAHAQDIRFTLLSKSRLAR